MRSRESQITSWARELGFDRVGFATLGPSRFGTELEEWLARGDHATMQWLERRVERRRDPRLSLEGARTAVCVARDYAPLELERDREHSDLFSGVARYALGDDYHDFMLAALRELGDRIEASFPGARTRSYVDTGPLLEREIAALAGLGAVGKHTNLISRSGSWFLLGEVLTTLELEPSEPVADLCGSCTRCLDHCPTDALPEPYRLDARHCISYWTIEHRGTIPREVRPSLGQWVFGCDVCQEVCPWNGRLVEKSSSDFEIPARRRDLDLVGVLELDREAYVEAFRRSPLKRAKLEGLKRNAAVAMGNRREPKYAKPLARALRHDDDPMVRAHCAWALGQIGGEEALTALGRELRRLGRSADGDRDRDLLEEIEQALSRLARAGDGEPALQRKGPS